VVDFLHVNKKKVRYLHLQIEDKFNVVNNQLRINVLSKNIEL